MSGNFPFGPLGAVTRKANELISSIEEKVDPRSLVVSYKAYKARISVFYNKCNSYETDINDESLWHKFNDWHSEKWSKIYNDKSSIDEYMRQVMEENEISLNLDETSEENFEKETSESSNHVSPVVEKLNRIKDGLSEAELPVPSNRSIFGNIHSTVESVKSSLKDVNNIRLMEKNSKEQSR